MFAFPWFPLGYRLPGGSVGRLQREGGGYQIVDNQAHDSVFLVLERTALVATGAETFLDPTHDGFHLVEFGSRLYLSRLFERSEQPVIVRDWPKVMGLPTSSDASNLGKAVRRLREAFPKADVGGSLFLPAFNACLPVDEADGAQDLRSLGIQVLAAGARVPLIDINSIHAINSWLTSHEIEAFLAALDIEIVQAKAQPHLIDRASFTLPGRPDLEQFFREYILEPSLDRQRYATLGVKMPNGVLLYGPPGSGKSYAVGKLRTALGWSTFEIDLAVMGSPFIHQTSVALRKVFDEATSKAPSLILLEEIDAVASTRGSMSHDHKVEEVTELLRLVEAASANNVLVVATTNRREALDPAILRKGRFDHSIEVSYPTGAEVYGALVAMLEERPHIEISNLHQLATKLAGRPMSDVAWTVNEAARLAARAKKDAIDEIDLFSAFKRLRA
jgi:cell division protease FtsH